MTTKLRQQMGEKFSGSRLPQFTQFTPKKHHHLSLPADQGPTVWVVIEWALGKLGPGPNCLPQKSGQLGPGPACDEYIQIFEYIGHKYLFGHSFVSNLFVQIYLDIRLCQKKLYEYIWIFARVKFVCTNIFGNSFV